MNTLPLYDLAVIGGGVVGASIAYGAAKDHGLSVLLLDEGDQAFRAARGNFGLIWVQGKGAACPAYTAWTRHSASLWPDFARTLENDSGIPLQYQQTGGLRLCLSDADLQGVVAVMNGIRAQATGDYPFSVLDNAGLRAMCPAIGPEVAGGIYCPMDGHVSPQHLLRALITAFRAQGGQLETQACVHEFARDEAASSTDTAGYRIMTTKGAYRARRIVLAAGLGNARLAPMLGLSAPVRPNRGQVLITERLSPFLSLPTMQVRQTGDGTVQIGDSQEDVWFDERTTHGHLQRMAEQAVRCFPVLAEVNLVRAWGALRVMSPDGLPIYEASREWPGAFLVTCHSGITLAATHAKEIATWVAGGGERNKLEAIAGFRGDRFDVQAY